LEEIVKKVEGTELGDEILGEFGFLYVGVNSRDNFCLNKLSDS
jgi:hypothetical protein